MNYNFNRIYKNVELFKYLLIYLVRFVTTWTTVHKYYY